MQPSVIAPRDRLIVALDLPDVAAAEAAFRGGRDREDALAKHLAAAFLRILHPRHPVDGILDQRRHRRIIFRRHDQDAVMRTDHALEIDRVLRHARFGLQIAVIDRQRKVAERNAGDFHAGLGEFIGRRRRKPGIVRAGAKRAGDHEDFQRGHD